MRFIVAAVAAAGLAAVFGMPAPAAAHGWHDGPWYYGPWHPAPWHPAPYYHRPRTALYFGFGGPIYREPPPVVVYRYAPPPTVIYTEPAPVTVSPASPVFTDGQGRTCREYQTTVSVGGAVQPAFGTACLQPDGSWRVVR